MKLVDKMKDEIQRVSKGKMADVIYENCGGDIFDKVGQPRTESFYSYKAIILFV